MGDGQTEKLTPIGYLPGTFLTIEQVAEWLQISKRAAERLHLPCFYLGARTRRYLAKTVIEHMEKKVA